MSRPIGAHFHVAHGLSNAMLLPVVTAFSAPAAIDRYADCARAMGIAGPDTDDRSAVSRPGGGTGGAQRRPRRAGPQEYGIDPARWEALIPTMAAQALASGSPANNPVEPSADEIVALYRRVWAA